MQRRIFLEAWSSSLFRSAKFTCQKKTTHKILLEKKHTLGNTEIIYSVLQIGHLFHPNLSKSENIRHKMKIFSLTSKISRAPKSHPNLLPFQLPPPRLYLSTLLSQSLYPVSSKPGFYLSQLNHHVPPKKPNSTWNFPLKKIKLSLWPQLRWVNLTWCSWLEKKKRRLNK